MEQIVYEVFQQEDAEETLAFWASLPGIHLHENGEDTVESIAAYLQRNPNCSFVARDHGKIVGAVLSGHDGRRGFINHLGVDISYRRQGIATHLLDLAVQELTRNGIRKCALFVLNDNIEGQAFYQSLGWGEETMVKTYSKRSHQ